MNWLESIEEAIGYIESHLKDDFSIEDETEKKEMTPNGI